MQGIYLKSRKHFVREPLIHQVLEYFRNLNIQQRRNLNSRVTSCLQAIFKNFEADKLCVVGWLAKTNNIRLYTSNKSWNCPLEVSFGSLFENVYIGSGSLQVYLILYCSRKMKTYSPSHRNIQVSLDKPVLLELNWFWKN